MVKKNKKSKHCPQHCTKKTLYKCKYGPQTVPDELGWRRKWYGQGTPFSKRSYQNNPMTTSSDYYNFLEMGNTLQGCQEFKKAKNV